MRKKRKLLRKITALLLSALLLVEMTAQAAPVYVLAEEETSFSGTDWTLVNKTLTIKTDAGMEDWKSKQENYRSIVTNAIIEDGVTYIADWAFQMCSNLTQVSIPNSATTIKYGAFSRCSSLTQITIPDSVTSIVSEAFSDCSSLTKIAIPNGVTSIGWGTFSRCSNLTEITIPDSVTSIGQWAFSGCSSLTQVSIPDSVTAIGSDAFRSCRSLTEITIPDGITSIGQWTFDGCSSLTKITIPDSVTSIGDGAFSDCRSLTEITIPNSVTAINDWVFASCRSLTQVSIPDSVTKIGEGAFSYCDSLKTVTMNSNTPPDIGNGVFDGSKFVTEDMEGKGIIVPKGTAADYKNEWQEWKKYITDGTPLHIHDYEAAWTSDNAHHWHECTATGCSITANADKDSYAAHIEDNGTVTKEPSETESGTKTFRCSICGYEMRTEPIDKLQPTITPKPTSAPTPTFAPAPTSEPTPTPTLAPAPSLEPTPTLTPPPALEPTPTLTPVPTPTSAPTSAPRPPRPPHTHYFSPEWTYNGSHHWHECSCGDRADEAMHIEDGGTVTAHPTKEEEGIRTYCCSVCGCEMRTESIDRLPSQDDNTEPERPAVLRLEVILSENAPETKLATLIGEAAQAVLASEDWIRFVQGTDITLVLTVEDAEDTISSADRKAAENMLKDAYHIGRHLNIGLFKVVGEDRTRITETAEKLTITIALPDSLKPAGNQIKREFSVLRLHGDETALLPDLDSNPDTVTIETDHFSIYTIVYKETMTQWEENKGAAGNEGRPSAPSHEPQKEETKEPKTGDTTPTELYATIAMIAGLSYVILDLAEHRHGMTEEKKNELTARLVRFARKGGHIRRMLVIAAIFLLLLYYHSIGKKTSVQWEEVYGK